MSKHVKGLILVVMLWIAVFAGFIAMKEYTLREGIEIELATVPVDPRDLLRGDYVILRYPMSTLTPPFSAQVAGARVGSTIYVDFDTTGQQAQPLRATLRKPDKGIFIRGTVESVEPNKVMVTYGIESFFLYQKDKVVRLSVHVEVR